MRIMGHGSSGGGGRGQNKWPRGTPLERAHKAQCTLCHGHFDYLEGQSGL